MNRARTAIGAAVAASALLLATAAPAAADHFVSYGGGTCYAGQIASRTGLALETTSMVLRPAADGSVRFICIFRGLPESTSAEDNGYVDWQRPERTTTQDTLCAVGDGTDLRFGDGVLVTTPGGTIKVDCRVPAA